MPDLFADIALLPNGWAKDVRIAINETGDIEAVSAEADPSGAERLAGAVLPGMPNLHSHAFQRAMAGLAERAGPDGDSFWTWRETMYRLAVSISPEGLLAVAAQLYVEMLKAGYTAVGEFHYLHRDPAGRPYADPAQMCRAVIGAAQDAGIGLTLLPVLYRAGGFNGAPTEPRQNRFVLPVDGFLDLAATLIGEAARDPNLAVGAAPHSLRAVPPDDLAACLAGLDRLDAEAPVHMHVAEQVKEVEDCLAWSGARPVEWLLANAPISERWCLVHATHMTPSETSALAKSDAVAGLCPSTEANLGDGLFPLPAYLAAGGRFGIGSDSHISVSPVEELRWLEYGQRLLSHARNIAAGAPAASTGTALFTGGLAGGAQALARRIGSLAPGNRADLIVLDREHPIAAGHSKDTLLDALVFSGNVNPIRDVMVGGRWVVRDGRHDREEEIASRFRSTVSRLASA
ncbi:MAG: formimidoylglutamate deiminase [Alphaproteobacteria bacterium]|nr:formimidoylglutamate deiminase [Alphaproteobacteria bacterium]